MSNMAGLTSQLITNAQGQVSTTFKCIYSFNRHIFPKGKSSHTMFKYQSHYFHTCVSGNWNTSPAGHPASLAGAAAASALPAQGLQVQTVSPQLLINSQGQIIATIGNGPTAAAPSAASVFPKATLPLTLTKTSTPVLKWNPLWLFISL